MALAAAIGAAAIAVAAETPAGGADSLASVDGRYAEWLDLAVPPRVKRTLQFKVKNINS